MLLSQEHNDSRLGLSFPSTKLLSNWQKAFPLILLGTFCVIPTDLSCNSRILFMLIHLTCIVSWFLFLFCFVFLKTSTRLFIPQWLLIWTGKGTERVLPLAKYLHPSSALGK